MSGLISRFCLRRDIDESGISGTGVVLWGCVYPTGRVVVEWRAPKTTLTVYASLEEFRAIHMDSHPGCSDIVWIDTDGWGG